MHCSTLTVGWCYWLKGIFSAPWAQPNGVHSSFNSLTHFFFQMQLETIQVKFKDTERQTTLLYCLFFFFRCCCCCCCHYLIFHLKLFTSIYWGLPGYFKPSGLKRNELLSRIYLKGRQKWKQGTDEYSICPLHTQGVQKSVTFLVLSKNKSHVKWKKQKRSEHKVV